MKKKNTSVYIYNEEEIDEMMILIRDSFISAFNDLAETLQSKLSEITEEE